MWVWSGFVLSLGLALVAWARSLASSRTYYEGEVYGMGPTAHRKYGLGFAAAAAFFLAELAWPGAFTALPGGAATPTLIVLSAVVLMGIFYLAGFLRGASGEDE